MEEHFVKEYLPVEAMAEQLKSLFVESRDNYGDDKENEFLRYRFGDDFLEDYAFEFALEFNEDMRRYLHYDDQRMEGNFANVKRDYEDEKGKSFSDMVAKLDAGENSEEADEMRTYLLDWFFKAFGTWSIQYNFESDTLGECLYCFEKFQEENPTLSFDECLEEFVW